MVDAGHVAITLAGEGVLLLDRAGGGARHLPAHPVAGANDVGAGDSFAAAAGLALAAGAGPEEAARIGIDAGSIAVTKRRTAVVGGQELLQRVSLRVGAEADPDPAAVGPLAARLDAERLAGRRIVFTNGVFDILHAGHVRFLREARALGDLLVVGVNSDRSARRLKGASRPITGERDRLALVAALDAVDHALLFDEETPAETIRALRPHIHVKGGDYAGETLPEAEAVRAVGGRIEILPLSGGLSTSKVIDRILALAPFGQPGSGASTADGVTR
jgi:D-beta-D-heptose 7-phosphate kinase/D-beta-D-heptose 1-phosphate adenosyltransferase